MRRKIKAKIANSDSFYSHCNMSVINPAYSEIKQKLNVFVFSIAFSIRKIAKR